MIQQESCGSTPAGSTSPDRPLDTYTPAVRGGGRPTCRPTSGRTAAVHSFVGRHLAERLPFPRWSADAAGRRLPIAHSSVRRCRPTAAVRSFADRRFGAL
jgi:hypothetical protein